MRTYGRLREKIKEVYGSLEAFAYEMGMHPTTLGMKLNSKRPWTQPEIEMAYKLLGLSIPQDEYFFY